jgi:chaperonin cofactor prefoldin
MVEELHPLADKYYERVRRYLEGRDLWKRVVSSFSRGAPAPVGERRIREAVSRILDRCEYHGVDPEALDWDVIAERFQFHETVENLLRDLHSSQLIPPPSPEEGAAYVEEAEREAFRLISVFEQLPPDAQKRVLDELLARADRFKAVARKAKRAEELEAELRKLRRQLAQSEAELKRMREKLAEKAAPPPPAPPPPPKPEWERRLERMKAEFDRRVRDWAALFVPAARREVFLRRASEAWSDYREALAAALRQGDEARAEHYMREALREAAYALLDAARDRRRALEALAREGVISRSEVPAPEAPAPEAPAPPGYVRVPAPRTPFGYAVAPWAEAPRAVDVAHPNPWYRTFGEPLVRDLGGGLVELHSSTYAALAKIFETLLKRGPPVEGFTVSAARLRAIVSAALPEVEAKSRWATEWLRDLLSSV